ATQPAARRRSSGPSPGPSAAVRYRPLHRHAGAPSAASQTPTPTPCDASTAPIAVTTAIAVVTANEMSNVVPCGRRRSGTTSGASRAAVTQPASSAAGSSLSTAGLRPVRSSTVASWRTLAFGAMPEISAAMEDYLKAIHQIGAATGGAVTTQALADR